ncbi:MAG: hypothetical protein WAK58_29960 [Trebonia sp.]|jgi:hypothetical protein
MGAPFGSGNPGLRSSLRCIQDNHPERTRLTADQAVAVLSVLTDGRRISVINAPVHPAPQETEPEELKENEPVTAQQGLSQ